MEANKSNHSNVPGTKTGLRIARIGENRNDAPTNHPAITTATNPINGRNTMIKLKKPKLIAAKTARKILPVDAFSSTFPI